MAFDILIVAHAGRLQFEALLLAASLRASDPDFQGRLIVAEPQPGGAWPQDPRIDHDGVRQGLARLGADIRPFVAQHFGASYPHGHKIEALEVLDDGPFLFLDTDTLITGPVSSLTAFDRPSASMRREGTWPVIELYGPGYTATWGALYRRFGLEFETTLDRSFPDEYWQRYLYFNAGWIVGRDGPDLGRRWAEMARSVRDDPPEELVCQPLDPWLDQVTLPLVIHERGGGRPGPELAGLDGDLTCHYRALPLLFARESDRVVDVLRAVTAPNWIKKILKDYDPFKRYLYQAKGDRARALFDRTNLPRPEEKIRKKLKNQNLWMR